MEAAHVESPAFGSSMASVPGSTAPVHMRRWETSNSISCHRSHFSPKGQAALYVGGGVEPGISLTTFTESPSEVTFISAVMGSFALPPMVFRCT